jgi:alpha-1,2-mannosyltransferase
MIVRLTGGPSHVRVYWLPAVIVVGVTVLWAARRLHSDYPWLAESLAMAAMLLISPVSWVHHWILVLPLIVACLRLCSEEPRSRPLLGATLALATTVTLGAIWWVPNNNGREYRHNTWQFLIGNSDVLLLLVTVAAALAATRWLVPDRAVRRVGASLRRVE